MIGLREDGLEAFRYKLRNLSDRELIQFGWELRKKCFKPKEDRCHPEQREGSWLDRPRLQPVIRANQAGAFFFHILTVGKELQLAWAH